MIFNPALYRLAALQHGLVTREQLLLHGMSTRSIERLLARGELIALRPAIYLLPGVPASPARDRMAAWLACGPGAVFSHRTAAAFWDIDRSGRRVLEVTVPRWRGAAPDGVIIHRIADLDLDHVVVRDGLPYTDPVRTLLDIGAVLPERRVGLAAERAFSDRLTTPRAVWEQIHGVSRRGRAGGGVIRRVMKERALANEVPDGMLEPLMAALLREHGLPPAVFQHPVKLGDRRMRIDFVHLEVMLAIEVDGYAWHRTLEQIQDDDERQNLIVELGYTPLRFTWAHVVRRPRYVAGTIDRNYRRLAAISA